MNEQEEFIPFSIRITRTCMHELSKIGQSH